MKRFLKSTKVVISLILGIAVLAVAGTGLLLSGIANNKNKNTALQEFVKPVVHAEEFDNFTIVGGKDIKPPTGMVAIEFDDVKNAGLFTFNSDYKAFDPIANQYVNGSDGFYSDVDGVAEEVGLDPSKDKIFIDTAGFNSSENNLHFELVPNLGRQYLEDDTFVYSDSSLNSVGYYFISRIVLYRYEDIEDKYEDDAVTVINGVSRYGTIAYDKTTIQATGLSGEFAYDNKTGLLKFEFSEIPNNLKLEITVESKDDASKADVVSVVAGSGNDGSVATHEIADGQESSRPINSNNTMSADDMLTINIEPNGIIPDAVTGKIPDKSILKKFTLTERVFNYTSGTSGELVDSEWFTIYGGLAVNDVSDSYRYIFCDEANAILQAKSILNAEGRLVGAGEYTDYNIFVSNGYAIYIDYKDNYLSYVASGDTATEFGRFDKIEQINFAGDYIGIKITASKIGSYKHKISIELYDDGSLRIKKVDQQSSLKYTCSSQEYYLIKFMVKNGDTLSGSTAPYAGGKVKITGSVNVDYNGSVIDAGGDTLLKTYAGLGSTNYNFSYDIVLDPSYIWEGNDDYLYNVDVEGYDQPIPIGLRLSNVGGGRREFVASLNADGLVKFTAKIEAYWYDGENLVEFNHSDAIPTIAYRTYKYETPDVVDELLEYADGRRYDYKPLYIKKIDGLPESYVMLDFGFVVPEGYYIESCNVSYLRDPAEFDALLEGDDIYTHINISGSEGALTVKLEKTELLDRKDVVITYIIKPIVVELPYFIPYDAELYPLLKDGAVDTFEEGIEKQANVLLGDNVFVYAGTMNIAINIAQKEGFTVITGISTSITGGYNLKDGYHLAGVYALKDTLSDGANGGFGGTSGNPSHDDSVKYNFLHSRGYKRDGNVIKLFIDGDYYSYSEFKRYAKDYGLVNFSDDYWEDNLNALWSSYFNREFKEGNGAIKVDEKGNISASGKYTPISTVSDGRYVFAIDSVRASYITNTYTYLKTINEYQREVLAGNAVGAFVGMYNANCYNKTVYIKNYEYVKPEGNAEAPEKITLVTSGYIYYDTNELNIEEISYELRDGAVKYEAFFDESETNRINYGTYPVSALDYSLMQWPAEAPLYIHRGYRIDGFDTVSLANVDDIADEVNSNKSDVFFSVDPTDYFMHFSTDAENASTYDGVATYRLEELYRNTSLDIASLYVRAIKIQYDLDVVAINNVHRVEREVEGKKFYVDDGVYTVRRYLDVDYATIITIADILGQTTGNIIDGVIGTNPETVARTITENVVRGYKLLGYYAVSTTKLAEYVTDDAVTITTESIKEHFGLTDDDINAIKQKMVDEEGFVFEEILEEDFCNYYISNMFYLIDYTGESWSTLELIQLEDVYSLLFLRDVRLLPVFESELFEITLISDSVVTEGDVRANYGTFERMPEDAEEGAEPIVVDRTAYLLNQSDNEDILKYLNHIKMNERVENFLVELADGSQIGILDLLFFAPSYIQEGYYFAGYRHLYRGNRTLFINTTHIYDADAREIVYSNNPFEVYNELMLKLLVGLIYEADGKYYWDIYADVNVYALVRAFDYYVEIDAFTPEDVQAKGELDEDEQERYKNAEFTEEFLTTTNMTIYNNNTNAFDTIGEGIENFTVADFLTATGSDYSLGRVHAYNTITFKNMCVKDVADIGEGKYIANGVYISKIKIDFTTIYGDSASAILELTYSTDIYGLPVLSGYKILVGQEFIDPDADLVADEDGTMPESNRDTTRVFFNFDEDTFSLDISLLAEANNTIKELHFDFEYSYKTYVINFIAGVTMPDLVTLSGSSTNKYSYLVSYEKRNDPSTWWPCDENGVILDGAVQGWVDAVILIGETEYVLTIYSLERTQELDVNCEGKVRFFSYWARDLNDLTLDPPYEELSFLEIVRDEPKGDIISMEFSNIFDSESGGTFNYYSLFMDNADINVHYYTWNPNAPLYASQGYESTAHKGYFWGNVKEVKEFYVVNSYELYYINGHYYYICGWLKIYDNIEFDESNETIIEVINTKYTTGTKYFVVDGRTIAYLPTAYLPDATNDDVIWSMKQKISVPRRETIEIEININMYAIYARYDFSAVTIEGDGGDEYIINSYVPNDVEGNSYINYPGVTDGNELMAESNTDIYFGYVDGQEYERLLPKYMSLKNMLNSGELAITTIARSSGVTNGHISKQAIEDELRDIGLGTYKTGMLVVAYFMRPTYDEDDPNFNRKEDIYEGVLPMGTMTVDGFRLGEFAILGVYANGTYKGVLDEYIKLKGIYNTTYAQAVSELQALVIENSKDASKGITQAEFNKRELIVRIALQIQQWDNELNQTNYSKLNSGIMYNADTLDGSKYFSHEFVGSPFTEAGGEVSLLEVIELLQKTKSEVSSLASENKLILTDSDFVRLVYALASYSVHIYSDRSVAPEDVYNMYGNTEIDANAGANIFAGGNMAYNNSFNAGDIILGNENKAGDGAFVHTSICVGRIEANGGVYLLTVGVRNITNGSYAVTDDSTVVYDAVQAPSAIIYYTGQLNNIYYTKYISLCGD